MYASNAFVEAKCDVRYLYPVRNLLQVYQNDAYEKDS